MRDTNPETDGGLEPHSPLSSPDGDPPVTSAAFVSGRESSTDSGTVVLERGSSIEPRPIPPPPSRPPSPPSSRPPSPPSSPDVDPLPIHPPSSPEEDSLAIPPPSSLDGDPRPIPPPSSLALVPYSSDDSDTEEEFPELVALPSLVEPQEPQDSDEFLIEIRRSIEHILLDPQPIEALHELAEVMKTESHRHADCVKVIRESELLSRISVDYWCANTSPEVKEEVLTRLMEQLCSLSSHLLDKFVELALELLERSEDKGRKNAILFFCAAFGSKEILQSFEAHDGLRKILIVLNNDMRGHGIDVGVLGSSASASLGISSTSRFLQSDSKPLPLTYYTCLLLLQYFRASFVSPVGNEDRILSTVRSQFKPLDISGKAVNAIFLKYEKDPELGHEFVRAIDNFLGFRGHITMLELCQAPFVKGYFDDLLQTALEVLRIVTVVPRSRKMILDSKLSNNVNGLAVILDGAEFSGGHMRTEIIQTALEVLVNLVCPLPKPPIMASESAVVDQGSAAEQCTSTLSNSSAVGQLQQWYCQARKDICTNHGVKVLLTFLEKGICSTPSRIPLHRSNYRLKGAPPPTAIAPLRALACRVLLALAEDGATALQLKVLQVGEKLTDLISTGSLTHGAEESRWQSELSKSAIELIQIVMNAGHASTLKASDFGMPTFRRIEGEAVAATTAVTFDPRELMYRIHEHLLSCGYSRAAGVLLEEAQLEQPVPAPSSAILEWPSGRSSDAFFPNVSKNTAREEDRSSKCDRSHRKKAVMRKCNLKSRNLSQSVQPMLAKTRKRSDRDIYSPSGKRICIDSSGKGLEICKCACPKPSLVRSITARLGAREISSRYSGVRGKTGNQRLLYSRFCASITCFDKKNLPWTCISYLSDSLRFAIGSLNGDLEVLDSRSSNVLHSVQAHEDPVVLVSTRLSGERDLVLSSSSKDVMLWDASIVGDGPLQTYHECMAATFCNSRDDVAVLSIGMAQKEILLYDITANSVSSKLSDPSAHSAPRVHSDYYIHFNPTDTQLLWNGVLWDTRTPNPVHHFEQFTDFGGGGFHPAGNEVIISSEVWDVRNFKLLKQVPHLKQTDIKFNSCGDVIYATRRRDPDNMFMLQSSHPLFTAFRTVDAKHYSEIATIPVNSVVYDLCTERTDSLLGLLIENPHTSSNPQFSTSVLVHKIGHPEPTNVFAGD